MIPRRVITIVLVAVVLGACGRGADMSGGFEQGATHLSVLSRQSKATLARSWGPVLKDMRAATGLVISPSFSSDDAALVQSMRERKTDVGWFSSLSGLEAVRRANGEVFARTVEPSGSDGYFSVLIVNAKRPLTIDAVMKCRRQLSFAMGDAFSTARALAPMTYLFAPEDVSPATCFRQVRVMGQQGSVLAVASGQVDVAAVDEAFLNEALALGRPDAAMVKVIWRSPVLPDDPIVWRKDLDPAIKEKLRQFFLTYGQGDSPSATAQRANLARIDIAGFRPADDSHLLPVREMEASRLWLDAKASRDKARIDMAKRTLDDITAQRQALEARTRAPAAAQ